MIDHNKVRGHLATDLIILIGLDHLDVMAGFLVQHLNQFLLSTVIKLIQHIYCIV